MFFYIYNDGVIDRGYIFMFSNIAQNQSLMLKRGKQSTLYLFFRKEVEIMKYDKYPNLTKKIEEKNKTIKEIGKLINVQESAMSYKLAGKRSIKLNEAKILCDYFKESFEYLFMEVTNEKIRNSKN